MNEEHSIYIVTHHHQQHKRKMRPKQLQNIDRRDIDKDGGLGALVREYIAKPPHNLIGAQDRRSGHDRRLKTTIYSFVGNERRRYVNETHEQPHQSCMSCIAR